MATVLEKSIVLLVSLILAAASLPAGAAWMRSETPGLMGAWNSVAYGDGVFVAVNGWGEIARSTDGGQTFTEILNIGWTIEDVEYGYNGSEMAFWATGRGSGDFLYESTDGGLTWTDIAGDFPYTFTEGGADIALDASGNLIYTKIPGNNNYGDTFLYGSTYYIYGGGPESSIRTSANGVDFTVAVADSGLWLLGGLQVGDKALVYGALFEVPGDFNTRKGALFDLTEDPTAPMNPRVIEDSVNTYVSDIDGDPADATVLYATGAKALLTSVDSGTSWTVDELGEGVSLSDMAEMAVGPAGRVAVGGSGIYWIAPGGSGDPVWAGLPVVDGYVDTADWLGILYVELAPWTYSEDIGNWIYLPQPESDPAGAWAYFFK